LDNFQKENRREECHACPKVYEAQTEKRKQNLTSRPRKATPCCSEFFFKLFAVSDITHNWGDCFFNSPFRGKFLFIHFAET
jgi:hypothetical protein